MSAGASAVNTSATGENFFVDSVKAKEEADARNRAGNNERVTQHEFLLLLTKQLSNQDPLKPMDNQQFLGQIAQLQALDEQINATKALVGLRRDSQLRAASGLIGKTVAGKNKEGDNVSGLVKSAVLRDDEVYVELDDLQRIPFDGIASVSDN